MSYWHSPLQITFSVVMVPQPSQRTLPFYDEISAVSGGRAVLVRQEQPVMKYWGLVTALRDICDEAISGSVTVASDIHTISDQHQSSSGDVVKMPVRCLLCVSAEGREGGQ